MLEALYSLTVDLDNGEPVHSVNGYASLWRWDWRTVKNLLKDCSLEIANNRHKLGRLQCRANAEQATEQVQNNPLVISSTYRGACITSAEQDAEQVQTPIKNRLKDKDIVEIITYLNTTTGKNFRPASKETQRHISARLTEGYTPTDFQTVIDNRVAVWSNDAKMVEFLRPATLFGTKFESYLQVANSQPTTQHQPGELPDYAN